MTIDVSAQRMDWLQRHAVKVDVWDSHSGAEGSIWTLTYYIAGNDAVEYTASGMSLVEAIDNAWSVYPYTKPPRHAA